MKISGSFITMVIIWALGFTNFLGGPYLFFRVIFWIALLLFFISTFVILLVFFKTGKLFKNNVQTENQETIHVEAVIKEE
jgi:uncharacterized membrane protein